MEEGEQVSWNLSQSLIGQIGENLDKANTFYLNGKVSSAFYCLKSIKFRIIQHMKNNIRKEFNQLEIKFNKALLLRNQKEITLLFEDYNNKIMDKLEEYGYLISKKEDRTIINA